MKNINKNEKDYVQVIYNELDRPLTTYPNKLTKYSRISILKKQFKIIRCWLWKR